MKTMNKNIENTLGQVKNTLEILHRLDIVSFIMPPEYSENSKENIQRISWKNHVGGRSVSSKAFLSIDQYLNILSSNAYQGLMFDNSIIRCSFTFANNKLISQNLLWWPCPVKVDPDMENEFGLLGSIKMMLEDSEVSSSLQMRSPTRFDFDNNNNTPYHPRAHVHMQHCDCRINFHEPICFNKFMKFILSNYYPDIRINFTNWSMLTYQYDEKHTTVEYINKSQFVFA